MDNAMCDMTFEYVSGRLRWCGADIADVARHAGTPCLVYSAARVQSNIDQLRAFAAATNRSASLAIALKAAGHASVVKAALETGNANEPCDLLCEVMSAEEYDLALKLGFKPRQIIVNGLGWQSELVDTLVIHPPFAVNVDNVSDCERLSQAALAHGAVIPIGVRLVPDEAAMFARSDEKMGIPSTRAKHDVAQIQGFPGVRIAGVSFHALHRCTNPAQMGEAAANIASQIDQLGLAECIEYIDIGGGLDYRGNLSPSDAVMDGFAEEITQAFSSLPSAIRLILEPGRFVFGDAAVVVTSVITRKQSATKNWLIVDAGTNLLVPVDTASFTVHAALESDAIASFNIADGICSPTSVIASGCMLPSATHEGDILAIGNAGAYAYALSENWGYAIPPLCVMGLNGSLAKVRTAQEARAEFMRHWGLEG